MSFSMDQLRSLGRDLAMVSQASLGSNSASSKEFLDLVKAIGESKSKAEEDRIMAAEIEHLKSSLMSPDVTRRKMKEFIVRLMYVDILGHDASFGYIYAVKMTHDDNILFKRTGYLACTLFLDDSHDLIILIVNTLQKDLKSDNHLVVCAALGAVCKLINEETIPAVLQQVVDLVSHPKELVRKKAVMALHRFHQRSPSSVSHVLGKFKEALCDKDPSVMGASLCALQDLIALDPAAYRNLVPSLLSILKQVVEGRLPSTYNYHKTPAPFVQIKLLKLLGLLGAGDAAASELIYPALSDIIRKGDSRSNIGNAILYECICTGATIVPSTQLLVLCAGITSKFLKSDSHNLKYMGIDALSKIVRINPDFANEHQLAVIDCLEDPDDTLKRKTLDLLYKMTRPANVEVIVEKMVGYLREEQQKLQSALHLQGKAELASRIIELAERFAPSNQWYIETMNTVFELAGDVVRPQVAHDLMRLIAEGGSGGDGEEDEDSRLRSSAVDSYVQLVDEPDLPPLMLQVICWVLGEYATSDGHMSAQDVLAKLLDITSSHSVDDSVRAYALTAMSKVAAFELSRSGVARLTPEAQSFVEDMAASQDTDLQQRALELLGITALPRSTAAAVMPEDASCEDIEVDSSLTFLDQFVSQAVEAGAAPYRDAADRGVGSLASLNINHGPGEPAHAHDHRGGLRFEAYELPKVPPAPVLLSAQSASASTSLSAGPPTWREEPSRQDINPEVSLHDASSRGHDVGHSDGGEARLRLSGVQRKWGRPAPAPQVQAGAMDPELEAGIAASVAFAASGQNGGIHDPGAAPPATAPHSRPPPEPQEPAIPEEKARLAASIFGGGGAGKSSAPVKPKGPRSHGRATAKAPAPSAAPRDTTAPSPAPAPAPLQDLLDLGDPVPPVGPSAAQGATVDPFSALAGLEVILPVLPAGVAGPAVNGSIGSVQTSESVVTGSKAPTGKGAGTGGGEKASAVQRDAIARQAGVASTTMGSSAELFRDILGS